MIRLKNLLQEATQRTVLKEHRELDDALQLFRDIESFGTQERFSVWRLDPNAPDYSPQLVAEYPAVARQVRQALNKLEALMGRYTGKYHG